MSFTYYDGIVSFAKKANCGLYLACKTSLFNDRERQVYTPKGKKTLVRQYSSGKSGAYNKSKGWMTQYGTGTGIEWKEYEAKYDRAKVLSVDALDEEQSFANGMTPSIQLLMEDFLDNQLAGEIDAANISDWYGGVPSANKKESDDAGYGIGVNNILGTINTLEMSIFDSGYDRESVLFIHSKAYANMRTAIQNKMGFANPNVIGTKKITVNVDTGISALVPGADDVLSVTLDVETYGRFIVVPMPADRMYTAIDFLSGDPADVTEAERPGGYVPADGAKAVYMLAIPMEAAFANVRYQLQNYLWPSFMEGGIDNINLRKLNEKMYGNVEVLNAGVNQKAAAYEADIRCVFGGQLYDNRKRNVFAVIAGDADDPSAD